LDELGRGRRGKWVGLLVKSKGIVNLLAGCRARTRPVTARVLVSGCELIFYLSMELAQCAENLRMLKKFLAPKPPAQSCDSGDGGVRLIVDNHLGVAVAR
jgi:hypothetical protein